jgi:shikimate kinase
MNLILIGLRGSGKTTVGGLLAARLGRPFVDLDDAVAVALNARSAGEAWRARGEAAFRSAEVTALRDALRVPERVLSLGGGTPTASGAVELLNAERASGRVRIVYLAASPAVLRQRLAGTDLASRPSLTGAGVLGEIDAVHAARDGLYRSLADAVIDTAGQDAAAIAEHLAKFT